MLPAMSGCETASWSHRRSRPRPNGSSLRRRAALTVVVLLLTLAACEAGPGAPEPSEPDAADAAGREPARVTIGLLNPLTGPFAALGEDVNDGFALYLEEQGGRLGGLEVELLIEDEANDPAIAREHAERLVEQGEVDVVAGFVNSGVAYAAAPVFVEAGVPLIVTVAGADDLTQRDAEDSVFRLSYTSSQDAMPMGTYACAELGYERAAVVALDYAFGWEAAGGFSLAFEDAGCDVVEEIYVPLDEQDWTPFVQQIDDDVDAVWAVVAGPDAIRFTQAYADVGLQAPLIGLGTLTDEEVLAQQQSLADGIVTTLHYSRALGSPENAAFVAAFEDAYGRTVSRYAEGGYAAAMVIDAALAAADAPTRAALIDALGQVEVAAPRGPLHFDAFGQAVYQVYVRQVVETPDGWENEVIEALEDVSQFWTYEPERFLAAPRFEERKGSWAR